MSSRFLSVFALALLASLPVLGQPILAPQPETFRTRAYVGAIVNTGGNEATFSGLGNVPFRLSIAGSIDDADGVLVGGSILYQNGFLQVDALRDSSFSIEALRTVDDNGDPLDTVSVDPDNSRRYVVTDSEGNVRANGVGFDPAFTREYQYSANASVSDAGLGLSNYSASSTGETRKAEQSTSAGFQVALARDVIGFWEDRLRIGVQAGFSLSGLDVESSGKVDVNLSTLTDTYAFDPNFATPTEESRPIILQEFQDLDGDTNEDEIFETGVPISTTYTRELTTGTPGVVSGEWRVEGAYYTVRLGPSLRAEIVENFFATASVGAGFTFVGSRFKAEERIVIDGLLVSASIEEENDELHVLYGFYAEAGLEWFIFRNFGLYLGGSYEDLGEYEQELGGREAKVQLGKGFAGRAGVILLF